MRRSFVVVVALIGCSPSNPTPTVAPPVTSAPVASATTSAPPVASEDPFHEPTFEDDPMRPRGSMGKDACVLRIESTSVKSASVDGQVATSTPFLVHLAPGDHTIAFAGQTKRVACSAAEKKIVPLP